MWRIAANWELHERNTSVLAGAAATAAAALAAQNALHTSELQSSLAGTAAAASPATLRYCWRAHWWA